MGQGSETEIMEATYAALCKHGYADLSIQKIADEFDKGKSLIYYHFDDKEDLMLAFLNYLEDYVEQRYSELEELPPGERLDEILDMALGIQDDEEWEFQKAFLEMRAQVPYNDNFADKFQEIDGMILDNMTEIVDELGVENPKWISEMLVSCMEGSINRKVAVGDREGLEELKNRIKDMVESYIVEEE